MEKKFYGYPREDGSVGTRNHVLIIPVQRVLNALASQISSLVSGTETTEVINAEYILEKREENEAVADALLQAVKATEGKARSMGEDIRSIKPIPENIAGGISTLEEKSLGVILKAGNSPLKGVIEYAQRIPGKGLYFMDPWMSSLSLPTGFGAAAGQIPHYLVRKW